MLHCITKLCILAKAFSIAYKHITSLYTYIVYVYVHRIPISLHKSHHITLNTVYRYTYIKRLDMLCERSTLVWYIHMAAAETEWEIFMKIKWNLLLLPAQTTWFACCYYFIRLCKMYVAIVELLLLVLLVLLAPVVWCIIMLRCSERCTENKVRFGIPHRSMQRWRFAFGWRICEIYVKSEYTYIVLTKCNDRYVGHATNENIPNKN